MGIRIVFVLVLTLLALDAQSQAATITVDTLVDENDGIATGGISLRDAINEANSNGQDDTIDFDVTGQITLTSSLPPHHFEYHDRRPGRTLPDRVRRQRIPHLLYLLRNSLDLQRDPQRRPRKRR